MADSNIIIIHFFVNQFSEIISENSLSSLK